MDNLTRGSEYLGQKAFGFKFCLSSSCEPCASWYSQAGMDGHPSAQARALVTLASRIPRLLDQVTCAKKCFFCWERFSKMYFPRRALKRNSQNGVYGGSRGLGCIYILDSHMAPYGACGFVQSKVRSSEVSPNVR